MRLSQTEILSNIDPTHNMYGIVFKQNIHNDEGTSVEYRFLATKLGATYRSGGTSISWSYIRPFPLQDMNKFIDHAKKILLSETDTTFFVIKLSGKKHPFDITVPFKTNMTNIKIKYNSAKDRDLKIKKILKNQQDTVV